MTQKIEFSNENWKLSQELLKHFRYNNAMPEACEMLKARTPEIDVLKELIEQTGFTDFAFTKDNEPLQGEKLAQICYLHSSW